MKAFLPPEAKNAKEAMVCFSTAFLFLLLGLALLALNSPLLAIGAFADLRVVAGLHFITLGWLSLSIFGALQVFTGVALGSSLSNSRSMLWTRYSWTAGVSLFPSGLFWENPHLVCAGLISLGLGISLFSWRLIPALFHAKRGQITRVYISLGLISLWIAFILGSLAGLSRSGLLNLSLPPANLSSHVLVAVFGWIGSIVIGVGSHLVPMFLLTKPGSTLALKLALPFWILIPISSAMAAFSPEFWTRIGWSAAATGSILWCIQFVIYFKDQLRSRIDFGMLIAASATLFLFLSWGLFVLANQPYLFIGQVLIGWLLLFTLGIYHRVIPFLVWFLRFSRSMALGSAPRVKDLLDSRISGITMAFAVTGIVVWIIGLFWSHGASIYGGSIALFMAAALCLLQIKTLTQDHHSEQGS